MRATTPGTRPISWIKVRSWRVMLPWKRRNLYRDFGFKNADAEQL